jgi:hypothetical protein
MENYFSKKIIIAFIFIAIVMAVLTPLWINQSAQSIICGVFLIILPLTLIICYTIVICKKMKNDAESEKQTTASTQKEKWEKFQYDLYREVNEKRFSYEKEKNDEQFKFEKEKFEHEKEKWLGDKIISSTKEISEIQKKIEALQEECKSLIQVEIKNSENKKSKKT